MADSSAEWTTTSMIPVKPGLWADDGGPVVAVLAQRHKDSGAERVKLGYADHAGTVLPTTAVTPTLDWHPAHLHGPGPGENS